MRFSTLSVTAVTLAILSGCNPVVPSNRDNTVVQSKRDNTAVNARDVDSNTKTPFDQNENKEDIDITATIRKQLVATKMSVNAHNVKITTQNGRVTLRGPVADLDEKNRIVVIANEVAGQGNVENELEVQ